MVFYVVANLGRSIGRAASKVKDTAEGTTRGFSADLEKAKILPAMVNVSQDRGPAGPFGCGQIFLGPEGRIGYGVFETGHGGICGGQITTLESSIEGLKPLFGKMQKGEEFSQSPSQMPSDDMRILSDRMTQFRNSQQAAAARG